MVRRSSIVTARIYRPRHWYRNAAAAGNPLTPAMTTVDRRAEWPGYAPSWQSERVGDAACFRVPDAGESTAQRSPNAVAWTNKDNPLIRAEGPTMAEAVTAVVQAMADARAAANARAAKKGKAPAKGAKPSRSGNGDDSAGGRPA
ncbi:MAG: hypothetical protein V7603_1589 [Micromonosporaceae bacterium]